MSKNRIQRALHWLEDRFGLGALISPMLRHPVPKQAGWWYVFGSVTLTAFLIQVVTGVALAFSYIPSASQAHDTLHFITEEAPFGSFLRGMHFYGASAMVLMIGIHAVQVFLFGAYKFPREMNWVTGVVLLGLTLLMGFTGQLLRWDQTAVWSVIVAAEQAGRTPLIGDWLARFTLGGGTVGGATLSRFFAIHVFIVPALIFAFIGLHVWLVLRHGVSEPPKAGHPVDPRTYRQQYEELLKKAGHPFWPNAAWRDVVAILATVAGIALLALLKGAPELGKAPDPSIIEADPRPDWYLLWYFALLALLPNEIEKYFMVFAPLLAGVVLLVLPLAFNKGERSPRRRPWAVGSILLIVTMIGAFWVAGLKSNWSPNFQTQPLPPEAVGVASGPVADGAKVFYTKGCLNCHLIGPYGGRRGPDLTTVAARLLPEQIIIRIANGGGNMPAYADNLTPRQMDDLVAFLKTRYPGKWRD